MTKKSTGKNSINKRLDMYRERMQEIVSRLDVVEALLRGNTSVPYRPAVVESVYLQFRNVLELIATASLVINKDADDLLRKEGMRTWHAGDILKAVEMANPDYYYPKPLRLVDQSQRGLIVGVDGYRGEWKDFKGDYLTREKFMTLYKSCGSLLHVLNPFNKKANRNNETDRNKMQQAPKWRKRIIELLTHHMFKLVGEEDVLYLCHTVGPDAQFVIQPFSRLETLGNPTPQSVAEARKRMMDSGTKLS